MKTTSRFALAAAAGLFAGALAISPARAADLGGDCCADLEERVAELEATTVRKGNRVVSVEVYGQVNKALLIWDDGIDSDVYVTDNDVSSTRMGLRGKGTIKPGWTAGFRMEWEMDSAGSETVGQDDAFLVEEGLTNGDDGSRSSEINVRRASLYIESENYGRVQMGLTSSATDDITLINLGGTSSSGQDNDFSQGFLLRPSGYGDAFTSIAWGDIAPGRDIGRIDGVRYDSPAIYGFIFSAAWGEDDFWDVALRFSKQWNSIRIAAGIGYQWDGDDNDDYDRTELETVRGAFSIMHMPTGIYGTFAGVEDDFEGSLNPLVDQSDPSFYYGQLGIAKNWTGHGNTIIYGEYGQYEDYGVGSEVDIFSGGGRAAVTTRFQPNFDSYLASSEVDYYGFGVEQKYDSAALSIFANLKWYEADLRATRFEVCGEICDLANSEPKGEATESINTEDWFAVVIGSRIKF